MKTKPSLCEQTLVGGSSLSKYSALISRHSVLYLALCSPLLAPGFSAEAQQAAKIPKIGFLGARSVATATGLDRLRKELAALGYSEGKNIAYDARYADNRLERLPGLADELIRLPVDVIVTAATPEVLAAKDATRTIPIIFVTATDPVKAGLVDSLARPSGNITGFTTLNRDLGGKRLELLKDTIPDLSDVAVLWSPQDQSSTQELEQSRESAAGLGLKLHSIAINQSDISVYENVFRQATQTRSRALAITSSPLTASNSKMTAELAVKYRLPAIGASSTFVTAGGLMSYGTDRAEPYKRVAAMIEKLLKGHKPGDIPVERSSKFEFVISLKTAKQIGLKIPPSVLARAERVIR